MYPPPFLDGQTFSDKLSNSSLTHFPTTKTSNYTKNITTRIINIWHCNILSRLVHFFSGFIEFSYGISTEDYLHCLVSCLISPAVCFVYSEGCLFEQSPDGPGHPRPQRPPLPAPVPDPGGRHPLLQSLASRPGRMAEIPHLNGVPICVPASTARRKRW